MTATESLSYWENKINERHQSGMTIKDWCQKNGVTKNQYFYWNHRIRKSKNLENGEFVFADVSKLLTSSSDAGQRSESFPDFQIHLNSIQATVPSNFNPDALAGLLKVLKEL
jgi:hypothetical protein